jgi:hypothetical protein
MLPNLNIWLNHFEYHSQHPRRTPDGISNVLTADERKLIACSVATFQLGEQSAGTHLLRSAYRCAQQHDAASVARVTELFILEEQRHAALLRTFMETHAIPTKQHDWTDRVFRRVRQLAQFEHYLSVLLTAELIGIVYYRALETVTGCQRLRLLCRMLVADELAHIGFESDLVLAMRAQKSAPARVAIDMAHRVFLVGTATVVWITHRAVLRRSGYNAFSFLKACIAQYAFYIRPLAESRLRRFQRN